MSVARNLRAAIEDISGNIGDIIMLGIGIAILAVFLKPIIGAAGQIKALIQPTGTVGAVRSTNVQFTVPRQYLPQSKLTAGYTPIQQFFRQLYTEHQQ